MTASSPMPTRRSDTEYLPAGEAQGTGMVFTAGEIASAFNVAADRVERAFAGEFGLAPDEAVTSKRAQHLAEVMLADRPMDEREAALMRLGAFTPRPDQAWGLGETASGEESDRFAATSEMLEDERASETSSHDPAYPSG